MKRIKTSNGPAFQIVEMEALLNFGTPRPNQLTCLSIDCSPEREGQHYPWKEIMAAKETQPSGLYFQSRD